MELVAKHNKDALKAAKEYAKAKPWQGSFLDKAGKIRYFHAELLDAYGVDFGLIIDTEGGVPAEAGGFLTYDDMNENGTIVLRPGFAVMTYLRLFAEALTYRRALKYVDPYGGVPEYVAAWANSLFKKAFPKSFEQLVENDAPILTRDYA